MKNNISYLIAISILLITFSCKEDVLFEDRAADGTPPSEVTIDEIIPKAGKLVVHWNLPEDEDFLYVKVSYPKEDGDRVLTFSKFNEDSITIPNLKDQEYTLTFQSVDVSGSVSDGITQKATPLKPAYKTAAETADAVSTVGAIIFDWDNPSADTLLARVLIELESRDSLVDVRYTGSTSTIRVAASESQFKYKIEFLDPEHNSAISEAMELAASPEIKFDRTRFLSDYSGYSSFMNVFNGDFASHFAAGGPFPKTFPFEYDQQIFLSRILLYVSRRNEGNIQHFPREVEVWTSMTGNDEDFVRQAGPVTLKEVEPDRSDWYEAREIVFENVPQCRYIKLVTNSTYSGGTACVIGEIEVFGAEVN